MNSLQRRVDRLEHGNRSETFVVGYVPKGWPGEGREEHFEKLAMDAGRCKPFTCLVLEDDSLAEPAISFAGDADIFFGHIARYGKRISEPDDQYLARAGDMSNAYSKEDGWL